MLIHVRVGSCSCDQEQKTVEQTTVELSKTSTPGPGVRAVFDSQLRKVPNKLRANVNDKFASSCTHVDDVVKKLDCCPIAGDRNTRISQSPHNKRQQHTGRDDFLMESSPGRARFFLGSLESLPHYSLMVQVPDKCQGTDPKAREDSGSNGSHFNYLAG